MDVLRTSVSALAAADPDRADNGRDAGLRKAARLIAQLPTIIARHHRRRQGLEPVAPDPELGYAENFLAMLHGAPPSEAAARAFDVAMILHAEHELNASTFTARVIAGTGADLHAALVGGIAALSGPLHGGANAAAMELFERFGSAERTPDEVRGMLERKERLYGFGHPLYRAYDPRATILKRISLEFSEEAGQQETGQPNWYAITEAAERTVFEEKAPVPERRPLLGLGLHLPRRPHRSVHAALRGQPGRRPGGARARAAGRQQDHPPLRRSTSAPGGAASRSAPARRNGPCRRRRRSTLR